MTWIVVLLVAMGVVVFFGSWQCWAEGAGYTSGLLGVVGLILFVGAFVAGRAGEMELPARTSIPTWNDSLGRVVDPETGCEYLAICNGGITPRLDAYGQHMGCRRTW